MLSTVLMVILILLLLGALPTARYYPGRSLGLALLIVLVLVLIRQI